MWKNGYKCKKKPDRLLEIGATTGHAAVLRNPKEVYLQFQK